MIFQGQIGYNLDRIKQTKKDAKKEYHKICDRVISKDIEYKEKQIGTGRKPLLCRVGLHFYTKQGTFKHPAWWEGCSNIVTRVKICRRRGCNKGKCADVTSYHTQ